MEAKGIVAASQPQWIPVTERLPEPLVYVLIYDKVNDVCIDYHDGRMWGNDRVTHWMPLPAPPKAGE